MDSTNRLRWIKFLLLAAFAAIGIRLVQIQVFEASMFQAKARRQHEAKIQLLASRGAIYDRNGRLVVSNVVNVSFVADPKLVGNRAGEIASRFAQVFGKPRSIYLAKLEDKERRFVWLERGALPQYARFIDTKKQQGLLMVNEPRRVYHYGQVAGQIVGTTDIDNNGLTGLELQRDEILKGRNGFVIMQNDGLNQPRPSVDYPREEPVNGRDIVLTMDIDYQTVAEEELRRGIEASKADEGLVVMMQPFTGEVLALAQYPGFNPVHAGTQPAALSRIRAITDQFEPGSMFKIVAASAAIEHGLVKPWQKFNAENGRYVRIIGKERVPLTDTHPYQTLTFEQAVAVSSNIVMAKVSDVVGGERLYKMAQRYGFGIETMVELPGEIRGELKVPGLWSGTTLNSMAIGYEVGVTPLQVAAAYCAVANGGMLMKPYIIKQIVSPDGEIRQEDHAPIRRVISKTTAETLARFFEEVVESGTGKEAKVRGLRIAGKTSTARKNVNGKYETDRHTASFVGYFPAESPEVVCLVMLDHPREGGQTGGMASAPIFREIARKVSALSGKGRRAPMDAIAKRHGQVVPDVVALRFDDARRMLASSGFQTESRGSGSIVRSQSPQAGSLSPGGSKVVVGLAAAPGTPSPEGVTIVPAVAGLPMRRVVSVLALQQLSAAVSGSGIATAQFPPAGTQVRTGTKVTVRCEPKNLSLVNLN